MPREDFFKKELVAELRRVENLIRKEPIVDKKVYYFSAAYGITSRTFRYSFSKDVLFADFVLQGTYNLLLDRLGRLKSGDLMVPLEEAHFEMICDGLRRLADKFEAGESILEPLEDILLAVYTTTGAGLYMREKGDIKL